MMEIKGIMHKTVKEYAEEIGCSVSYIHRQLKKREELFKGHVITIKGVKYIDDFVTDNIVLKNDNNPFRARITELEKALEDKTAEADKYRKLYEAESDECRRRTNKNKRLEEEKNNLTVTIESDQAIINELKASVADHTAKEDKLIAEIEELTTKLVTLDSLDNKLNELFGVFADKAANGVMKKIGSLMKPRE